jgi:hypothetical protein
MDVNYLNFFTLFAILKQSSAAVGAAAGLDISKRLTGFGGAAFAGSANSAIPHLAELPGIRWKLHNLEQLAKRSPKKFLTQAEVLERLLGK